MTGKRAKAPAKPPPTCKDCGSPIQRKDGTGPGRVRKPGPRCATCWDIEDKRRKAAEHERAMAARFGLEPGDYDRLFAAQGGKCYLCGRSSRRRLNVDHDHRMPCAETVHPPERGCRLCVRGLVDDPCNEYIGRVAHDRPEVFARGYWYLTDPPARKILNPPTFDDVLTGLNPRITAEISDEIVSFDRVYLDTMISPARSIADDIRTVRDQWRDADRYAAELAADHNSDGHGGPF